LIPQKFLISNFFFSLNLRHIKKIVISSFIVQNILVASKTKKKEKREKQKKQNCSKRCLWDSAAEN